MYPAVPPGLTPDEIIDYLRKSRTDDPALTVAEVLAKHEQMLDDWVDRNLPGLGRVPEENRYREVVSGETIEDRPKIQEVLRRIESPRIKAILCVEPQRLSRGDLEDIGRLVKLLRYSNTLVITLQYTYDLRDERDRDAFERELKRGNEFLEYQKRIMNNGRLLSVQNGNFIGRFAPYGYKKITVKDGKRTCHTLEIEPEEARVVRLIFEMYAQGYGSHKIARTLDEMGAPTRKGGKWAPESLKRMRTNHHYLGMVRWNYRKEVKTVEDGEIRTSRPMNNEYLLYPGKQDPIIDQELWDKVQEIRDKIPPVKDRTRHANPLAGVVYCQCGRSMSRRTYKNKGVERTAPRLLCDDQTHCGTPSCTLEEMMAEVVKILQEAIENFEVRIKENVTDSAALHRELLASLEQRLEDLNKRELAQWDKYTQEGMPKHIFDQLNEKVLKEKEEVQQALCTMKDSVPEPVNYEEKKKMFSDALAALQDPDAPVRQQNMLVKQCIERIVYSRGENGEKGNRWKTLPMTLDVHLRV